MPQNVFDQFDKIAAAGRASVGAPAPDAPTNVFDQFDNPGAGNSTAPHAAVAPPPPKPKGLFERVLGVTPGEAAHKLYFGAGNAAAGLVGDTAGLIGNPLNHVINATGLPQRIAGAPLSEDLGGDVRALTGAPEARNDRERIEEAVQRGAAGGLGFAGAGRAIAAAPGIAGQFGQFLAQAPVVDTVAGGTAGASQEAAQQAGAPEWAQLLAGLGGGIVGGGGAAALEHWRGLRGQPMAPNGELLPGSLDGGPGEAPTLDPNAAIRGVGANPDNFTSPEVIAERIARARARRPIAPGMEAPRVPPADTTIIGAPEGNIRSDDTGGIAGVERKRAADTGIFGRAEREASDDPVIHEILNAPISTQAKVATLFDRLTKLREDIANSPSPWEQPSAEHAARAAGGGNTTDRMHSITAQAESRNRDTNPDGSTVTSPKGAKGRMQVLDSTNADPGFGVRPAADASPAERARVGRDYIDALMKRYDGDPAKAWAAYNWGPGNLDHALAAHGDNWLRHAPAETQNYVRKNIAALGIDAPAPAAPFRMSAPDEAGTGFYSSRERVRRDLDDAMSPPVEEHFRGWEDTTRPTSPTQAEMAAGRRVPDKGTREAPITDQRMATGSTTRAFRSAADDPAGQPGFWEGRARQQHEEAFRKAQADLEAEWARRAEEAAQRQANAGADARMAEERTRPSDDPAGQYGGKYDQRPHKPGDFYALTPEGYIAGKTGKPVAFRNSKDAARFAVQNQLGGDFDRATWKANSQRVVLKRREGSTYGDQPPPASEPEPAAAAPRTDFERAVPPAGRSADQSQRMVEGPQTPQSAPPAPETPPPAPETPKAPYRAPAASPGNSGPSSSGPVEQVVTARGRPVDTRFEVVDARNLVSSGDPGFDPALQPRERSTRAASDAQVSDIASRLDPEQLGSSRLASQGAPIVGPDGMVESGNGRVASIRRAYELHPKRAAAYRDMIERRGFDTSGMEQPVLIRRRATDLQPAERQSFVREANERETMNMSSSEQARSDARTLSDDTLSLYRGGDVAAAGNRDFTRRWMDEVVPPAERNAMVLPDGSLSADGIRRMRASMLAKAFDHPELITKIVEDPDSEIRAIGNALTEAAPALAELKARVARGDVPAEFDITPQIADVASLIARARAEGKSVGDLLKQDDIFAGRVDPIVENLAGVMFRNGNFKRPRSAAAITEGLRYYTGEAEKVQAGPGLFGDVEPVKPLEIVEAAREKLEAKAAPDATGNLFGQRAARPGFVGRSDSRTLRNLRGDLDRIARDHFDDDYRMLADKLSRLVGDDALISYGDRMMQSRWTRGEAEPATNFAAVRREGDTETTLHEAVHLAAMGRYGWEFDRLQPGDLAASPVHDLLAAFNDARDAYRRGGIGTKLTTRPDGIGYALSSPDEFLSMALTNPSTQRFLKSGSLWDRVVDSVRKLFGLQPRFTPLLDRVLTAAHGVLDAAAGDPRRPVGNAPDRVGRPGLIKSVVDHLADFEDMKNDIAAVKRAVGDPIEAAKTVLRPLRDFATALTYTNDGIMRSLAARFDSNAIAELADKFHARAGKGDAAGRTYHEAVQRAAVTRIGDVHAALEPFLRNSGAMNRIRNLLTHPDDRSIRATAKEREAAGKLRDLLKETIEYRKDAGEDIGEVSDGYFPRVLDPALVSKGREKFLAAAEKLYRGVDADDPKGAAEAWFNRVFDTYSGLDGGLDHWRRGGAGGIAGNTAKARQFGKDADRLLRDFYHHDVFQTLASYFTGAARKAEEVRRFGTPGREGSAEREAWVKEHGDKTQTDVLMDRIKADVRNSEHDAGDVMHRLQKAYDSNLGRLGSVSHTTRTMISYLHAWNQISKMDHTLVTSLGELTMGFVRGGPRYGIPFVKDAAVEFARQLRGAHPSDAHRWAEAISVAQDAMVNQALTARIGAEGSTRAVQKTLAGYYKGILLHQFTEAERISASKMGRKFIQTLAQDIASPKARVKTRAARYLAELGVSDPEAFATRLRQGEPSIDDVRRDAPGLASDYTTALIRFVNQTVMAPSRAEKPAWSAHPVGSLFSSLLGYNFAFKKNVLDRVGRMAVDAVKEKDPALLLPAAMLPVMGVFQYLNDTYLRPELFGTNYDFSTETPTEAALRVADRAGFTGELSPILNAFKGLKYRRGLLESLSGPVLGSVADASEKILTPVLGQNSPNTNTAERNAAAAFYDAVVEPAVDATAAKYLRGVPRTAVIVGTGNKRGGALPGDRDAFTDEFGGPQQ